MFGFINDPSEMENLYNNPKFSDIQKSLTEELYLLKQSYQDTQDD